MPMFIAASRNYLSQLCTPRLVHQHRNCGSNTFSQRRRLIRIGSGKSTLAVQLEALYPSCYTRVNQDSLGNRKKCEILTRASLSKGKSVLIDRQNFDVSQRYTWVEIGHSYGVEVVALVFRTPKDICASRLKLRRNHETVKTPEQGLQILDSMSSIFVRPTAPEGFHRIVLLPLHLPLQYSLANANALLVEIEAAPLQLPCLLPFPPEPTSRNTIYAHKGARRGRGRDALQEQSRANIGSKVIMSHWLKNRVSRSPSTTCAASAGAVIPKEHAPAASLMQVTSTTNPSPAESKTGRSKSNRGSPYSDQKQVIVLDA